MRGAALIVALAVATLLAPAAAADAAVRVSFVQGEQTVAVERAGATVEDALRALLAGPTQAEARRGVRSHLPSGTPLRSATVSRGVATVDLGLRAVAGGDRDALVARLVQVVATADGVPGIRAVRVLVEGGTPYGLFPGIDASGPLTAGELADPDLPPPPPPPDPEEPPDEAVLALEGRLAELGYLARDGVDGRWGPATEAAVIGFQKWARIARDGIVGPRTRAALELAQAPTPMTLAGPGRRAEVLLDRQLTLAIEDDVVVRALHVSTGAAETPTPPGSYAVWGKFPLWWSKPYQVWMPYSVAFFEGYAFHQYWSVPVEPVSHGCVRITDADAIWFYDFMSVGTPVTVVSTS
jgi:L,D-transpeptidase-like protein/putative peptidoglycan binding protein/sporulation and spore germination protein